MSQADEQVAQPDEPPVQTENLRRRMYAHARDLLEHCPVLTVTEFEGRLLAAFPEATAQTEVLRSGRARSHNLVDWVKADLTRAGALHYLGHGKRRLMVYLPVIGQVQEDVLVSQPNAIRVIRLLGTLLFTPAEQ